MHTEPARIIALIESLLVLVVALGIWAVTDVQAEAILGFAGAVLAIIAGGTKPVRDTVWSPASHERELDRIEQAVQDGPPEAL